MAIDSKAQGSGLEAERQRLLAQLLDEEGLDAPNEQSIEARADRAEAPLSFAQELLWLLDRATPGLTAYNTPVARRLRGPLDVPALQRALDALVERHESLRTVFVARGEGGGAMQVVQAPAPVALVAHDLRATVASEREDAAISVLRAITDTPFDLARQPGFRAALAQIAENDHILLLLTHHIVSDAWSYGVLFRELNALYSAERGGTHTLAPVGLQYGDYAAWQRETLQGERLAERLAYWRERLADLPTLDLPTDFAARGTAGFAGARVGVTLPVELSEQIRQFARSHDVTLYMVLLAAVQTVLHRYSRQDDIVVGSAVAGRVRPEVESMIGYFSQALPMRTRFDGEPSFADLLLRVRDTVLGAFEHQDVPVESLILELQRDQARRSPLFRVVLTMQDALPVSLRLDETESEAIELDASATKFDLTFLVTDGAAGIEIALWYRTELIRAERSQRLLHHLTTLLTAAIAQPDESVSRLPLLTAAERSRLDGWNATTVDEGAPLSLVEMFEYQVARVPDRTAVVAGHAARATSLTYAELNARANQLARHLASAGVRPGAPVGLGLDRSIEAIVGLLGILKAGGCYVPMPPELPAARRLQQMRESGTRVVVTLSAHAGDAPADVTVVALDRDAMTLATLAADNPKSVATPERLAYVLFTSGSTGMPKGVGVTHANAVHYARAVSRVLAGVPAGMPGDGLAALDDWSFGLATTLGADLGNTSLFPSLLAGGTLHVLEKEVTTDPARWSEYMASHPLDLLKITPNHLHALVAGRQGVGLAAVLPRRWIVLGGEALQLDVAQALVAPGACRVLNHYGPTETTVGVLTFEATPETIEAARAQGAQTVPLGRPLANTRTFVVDVAGNEQPVGVPGELWIGGAGVSSGYFGRPEMTAERFVPFGSEHVYSTGDRARRLEDGSLEFLGRADDQVKVRGYRVELADVEQALRAHPGVDTGVVVLQVREGEQVLVAYAVAKQGYAVSHSDRPTPERLMKWLETQLPDYMVPSVIVLLDALPLTANGKVDRLRLPEPSARAASGRSDGFVPPRTATEIQLAAIWCEVLKRDRISLTDNFLALGGHSLQAIRLLGRISKTFGVRLTLRTLLESPTVEQVAAAVDRAVAER